MRVVIWGSAELFSFLKSVDQITARAHAARPAEARERSHSCVAALYQSGLKKTMSPLELTIATKVWLPNRPSTARKWSLRRSLTICTLRSPCTVFTSSVRFAAPSFESPTE